MAAANGVVIRPATVDDVRALDAIDAAAWDAASTPGPRPPLGSFATRLPLAATLVAVERGAVLGYVALADRAAAAPAPGAAADSDDDGVVVRSLAVVPRQRGRGIGAALMAAAAERARAVGCAELRLFVLGDNAPALGLYRKLGYQVAAVFPGEFEIEGRLVDDVVMTKRL